jgi:hypothetical protein
MSWIYNGKVFCQEGIPHGAIGFVYQMSAIINGKAVSYIGKKNFFSNTKTKLAKKNISTDKRLKKYKVVTKSAYQNYYSSNDILKKAHKDGVLIQRTILKICYSKTELTYQEVKHQFELGVLENELYLNGNILGRFYKQKQK